MNFALRLLKMWKTNDDDGVELSIKYRMNKWLRTIKTNRTVKKHYADLSKFIHITRLKEHVLNTRNTSKSCVACWYVNEDTALSDRVFMCSKCGCSLIITITVHLTPYWMTIMPVYSKYPERSSVASNLTFKRADSSLICYLCTYFFTIYGH